MWPEFALGYFNRGYNLDQSGAKAEAIRDYTAALERDPDFVPAYLNRGMACIGAAADIRRRWRTSGSSARWEWTTPSCTPGAAWPWRGCNALTRRTTLSARRWPGPRTPRRTSASASVGSTGSRFPRLPDKARAAFDEVLGRSPNQPQALYGKAMLLADEGRETEAIGFLDRAVEASPGFLDARRCRAVLQARHGNLEPADREISACLAQSPDSGSVLYAAACVSAWASKKAPGPTEARRSAAEALGLLEKAFAHGYGRDRAAQDPDLAALRDDPKFRQLVP